ncbi:MAG: DUF72 domain-containing protein [Planctomycetes bacterium]|nr:DUF72 domain-containing protein [Planctomycetota bacterium]
MSAGRCYIGTSGWSYPHWGKGRFYPRGTKPGDYLAYYSREFGTVEINASFYQPPRPEMIDRWREATGSRFLFAIKLWRRITHERKLADCEQELRDFLSRVEAFGPKRGPLLIQLPPSLHRDDERLDGFLNAFKAVGGKARWRFAVEFRHPSWLATPVYALLDGHGAACVLADLARCPIVEPNDSPFFYVRRHGPGGAYRGCYSADHLAADADRIRAWLQSGRDVYVYFNNDIEGHAIDNARQLRERVARS